MSSIERVGVVGTGQMGAGIAQVAAQAGLKVFLYDLAPGRAEAALKAIGERLDGGVKKGRLTATEAEQAQGHLHLARELAELADVDLVIEAVVEDERKKVELFSALDRVLKPQALLASNTSSIPITRLAAATGRPDRVVGMHFMNPVPVMKLVELIRGLATSDATFEAVDTLAKRMGKATVESRDMPGFIVNRVLMPMINEAVYALYEGIAKAEDIDVAMRLGTNQPMGPLTLADFIGLDTCLAIMEVLHRGTGDSKYRPCPLLRQYVDAGWLGRKTGRGFYTYGEQP